MVGTAQERLCPPYAASILSRPILRDAAQARLLRMRQSKLPDPHGEERGTRVSNHEASMHYQRTPLLLHPLRHHRLELVELEDVHLHAAGHHDVAGLLVA